MLLSDAAYDEDDELPRIKPPKRRKLKSKRILKPVANNNKSEKQPVIQINRLEKEFPQHNWLERRLLLTDDKDSEQQKIIKNESDNDSDATIPYESPVAQKKLLAVSMHDDASVKDR